MNRVVLLLVEDNIDDLALIMRALKRSDMAPEIVVARDGVEALAYLHEEERALPKFVLLDLNLPKMTGLEVLRRIREDPRTRHLPVVVLTSSQEDRDINTSYDLGASSYVRKPVRSERFADAVRQLGAYWLQLNESVRGR